MVRNNGSQEPNSVSVASTASRILVIDHDPAARRTLLAALASISPLPLEITEAERAEDGIAAARKASYSSAVVSFDRRALSANMEMIANLREAGIHGPIIATSSTGSVTSAVEAIRSGVNDFVVKPFQPKEFARRMLARVREYESARIAVAEVPTHETGESFEGFIGVSNAMKDVYAQIERVASSKAPVFVTGESGTGKEVCAEALHIRSRNRAGPFIALNCGAIPKELMESEIFGHVKGAFTSAHEDRAGAAELANGGTLFLDEICEMDFALQAKLLRFIQTGTFRRVGGAKEMKVNVRFVCATNRDPKEEVALGRFREDLYYRLHVLPMHLPSLRERGNDILLLARTFLARFAEEEDRHFHGFDADAEATLAAYNWPGNVRQLQNVIRRVVVLHDGELVTGAMLDLPVGATHEAARDTGPLPRMESPSIDPYWMQEQRIIEEALKAFDGNAQKAAAALEIAPSTIYRKMQNWSQEG
ncbi:MAG: sigma-54-dependent Fis family transcriptional regulator [Rhizobiales bacterium]|nr:sigma-54-dependent Fis family transcriptional regulator [Hyphomicrobiales bacterium]